MMNIDPNQWNYMWIHGEKVTLDEWSGVRNPANGQVIGHVPRGSRDWAVRAIDAASAAFPAWSKLPGQERSIYLEGWAMRLAAHRDELAALLSLEQGKPVEEAKGEIDGCVLFIKWYAEEAKRVQGDVLPGYRSTQRIMVWRQPMGVVGMITPWNFPAAMIARKAAPALAAGCTVVIKPSGQTPLIAIALLEHLMKTGIPPGTANLVTGPSEEITEVFLSDPRMRKISFTGSTEVGKKVMKGAADQVKRVSLELGGNAPAIVFADADVERAAAAIVDNKFENCGQVCNGINVIYVHRAVVESFTQTLVSQVSKLKVGVGDLPGVQVGPLINASALNQMKELVLDALDHGAQIPCGGYRLQGLEFDQGNFFAPTVITNVDDSMRVVHEEIFGPIAPIVVFDHENEVIKNVNKTPYGLAAYFFTKDLSRVYRVSEGLEFGMVGVNGTSLSVPQAPFGGIKESGMGREGGHYGLEEYTDLKYVTMTIEEGGASC
jgi:succinate-semialdehyde dehydrogenase / glutarate-semialdehyde dehydrogenase